MCKNDTKVSDGCFSGMQTVHSSVRRMVESQSLPVAVQYVKMAAAPLPLSVGGQETGGAGHVSQADSFVGERAVVVHTHALGPAVQHAFGVHGRDGAAGGETRGGGSQL